MLAFYLFFAALSAASEPSTAAHAIACRSNAGHLQTAELLDTWEARNFFHRRIRASKDPLEKQAATLLAGLRAAVNLPEDTAPPAASASVVATQMGYAASELLKNGSGVDRVSGGLRDLAEAPELVRPDQCPLEPLSNAWSNRIQLDQELYESLSDGDKAAYVAHEAFAALLARFSLESDPRRVRRAVGYVAGGNSFLPLKTFLGPSYVTCDGHDPIGYGHRSRIYFYRDPDGLVQPMAGTLFGTLAVGFFPGRDNANRAIGLDNLLNNHLCDGVEKASYPIALLGRGPVDFGRHAVVTLTCHHFQLSITLSPDGREVPGQAQTLSCHFDSRRRD